MENPFPGMDPWMEDQWGDAHHSIISFGREQIRPRLPSDLKARVEERVYVATDPPRPRGSDVRLPDLRVVERPVPVAQPRAAAGGAVAVAKPLVIRLGGDTVTEGLIEIRERRPSNRLVTVVEVLSPTNKRRGTGRKEYLRKQRECLRAGVNLVEIDLLRGGRWSVVAPLESLPDDESESAYRVSVWRAASPEDVEFYPIGLRDRLPAILVPLRETDAAIPLELQPLINQAYVSGEYDDTDYARPPVPPLDEDDYAWAKSVLKGKGLL
jgi:hypothetical protein